MAGDLAVGFLRELKRLIRLDVAGDHHHRVVGRVEAPVKADGVVARKLLHLVAPADHRLAVRMVEVQRGVDLLAQPRARIVADALVLLFEDDVALGQHHLVGELQAGHAVGLEFHHGLELLARHALEKGGVVARGEGVFLAADAWRPLARNVPVGFFAVPLNIRCSRKCASPDLPGVSSAAPTLYQIMWVTTGARWSGMTTSSSPLARVKSAILGPPARPRGGVASVGGARRAAGRKAIRGERHVFETLQCSSRERSPSPAARFARD